MFRLSFEHVKQLEKLVGKISDNSKGKMNENSVIRSFFISKLIKFTLPTIAMMIFTSIMVL